MTTQPIGVFDSGMGGLTVMRALSQALPQERFLYLGDTARLPYGSKSAETVRRYALQAASALVARGVKLIVIACNTASVALADVRAAFPRLPILGVIEPGAEAALRATPQGPIAVLATEGTVNGGAYVRALGARGTAAVVQQACPLFVPLAEEGLVTGEIAEAVARRYIAPLLALALPPRTLLLGCTHYPALKPIIAQVAGPQMILVDSAETTAAAVAAVLHQHRLSAAATAPQHPRFLVTDAPERFARIGEIFWGRPIDPGHVELIDLQ